VGEEDRPHRFRLALDLAHMAWIVRARIDHHRWPHAHDPRVRALQRERAGVRSKNSQDSRHAAMMAELAALLPLRTMACDAGGEMPTTHGEPTTARLAERLRRRIAASGPITFAEFMEWALYDPEEGFYASLPVGEVGHFVTSPHLSPVFGRLVARQVTEFWELLDRPVPFDVVEVGAGDGTLARQILGALPDELLGHLRYRPVERSASARRALEAGGLEALESLSDLADPIVGCILANELLDNLPFHRLRGTPDGLVELFVGVEGDGFGVVEGPPSTDDLVARVPTLAAGEEFVVSPATLEFVDRAGAAQERGYVWLVDYGFVDDADRRSVHGYRHHRVHDDVLADPGSTDITSGVDFAALALHARSRGFEVWGPVSQRDVLLSLGFRRLDQEAQARQVDAVSARRGIDALRIYSDRNRANLLLGREGLGAAWVLCAGKNTTAMPVSFRPR
jgi:SAM-dependent MidA family methyltransferase